MKDYLKNKLSSSFGYGLGDESIESIERQQHREARRKKDKPPTLRDIPKLTKDILVVTAATVSPPPTKTSASSSSLSEFTPSSTASQQSAIVDNVVAIAAAKKLYELCDVGHKANREPMVASGKYDVLGPLTQCLLHESTINTNSNSRNSSSNNNNNNNSISESNDTTAASFVNEEPKLNKNDNVGDNNTPVVASKENIDSKSTDNHDDSKNNNCNNTKRKIIKQKKKRVVYRQKDEKLHFVCLTLNNLSIPHDNKKVMVTERGARKLIGNLCKVIASGKKEAYLCCIVLMNLSFYEPGLPIIGQFSPSSSSSAIGGVGRRMKPKRKLPPLENPDSLLRILQDLISTVERGTSDYRWAFGLLANLSKHPENALLIGLTGIPRMAIDNLRYCSSCTVSASLPVKSASSSTSSATKAKTTDLSMPAWQTNSLEDFSLYFLLHLAESCPSNTLKNALDVIMPIMNCEETAIRTHNHDSDEPNRDNNNNNNSIKHDDKQTNNNGDKTMDGHTTTHNHQNGIQSLKATMICAFLGLEWDRFPDHGVIAAGAVSELMGNTFERVGKKHMYCDNDFGLRTAVAAYAALAKAASKADAKITTSAPSSNNNTDVATNSIDSDTAANDAVSTCTNEKVVARADDSEEFSIQGNPGVVDDSPSSVDDKGGLGADDKSNTQSEKIDGTITPDTDTSTATNTVLAADTAPTAAVAVAATASSSCVHTKVMALPTSVALLFQIINAIALHGGEDDTKNANYETYHWDIKAGDLAVTAVMYLLPA